MKHIEPMQHTIICEARSVKLRSESPYLGPEGFDFQLYKLVRDRWIPTCDVVEELEPFVNVSLHDLLYAVSSSTTLAEKDQLIEKILKLM